MKLSEIFSYPKLSRYEGLLGKVALQNKHTYFGIEVEAEGVSASYLRVPGSWRVVEDGSLKLDGLEFVTVPIKLMYLEIELQRLFQAIPNASFSCRTSIHTHMNVRDLTIQELEKFFFLYMIFEKLLYKISGDRFTNNFCVSVYEAPFLARKFIAELSNGALRQEWSKYHGLNLVPIWGQESESARIGTAEFRHMAGTNDVSRIMVWCDIIACLKSASKKFKKDEIMASIIHHNTSGKEFMYKVFGNHIGTLTEVPNWTDHIQACTTKIKLLMINSAKYGSSFGVIA